MVVGLQEELSTQFHVIALLVHFIDQHSVEVLILWRAMNTANVNCSLERRKCAAMNCVILLSQNLNSNVDMNIKGMFRVFMR